MGLDFAASYWSIVDYFQSNIYIAAALAGILLFLLYRKPRLFLTILLIVLVVIGSLFVISSISGLGETHKKKLMHESELG